MVKDAKIQKIILDIIQKIKENYQPEKIILFGSYAYGVPDEGSDIDLLIVKDTDERPIDRRIRIRQMMGIDEDALISPLVITPSELSRRLKIGDQFLEEILFKGEVLYG